MYKHILAITALSLHACTLEPLLIKDTEKGGNKFYPLRGQLIGLKVSRGSTVSLSSYSYTIMLTC